MSERWDEGEAYDRFMGRWSRPVASRFVDWLGIAPDADWLDVGCGTGSLLGTIARSSSPHRLAGVDRSAAFVATAQGRLVDAELSVADAQELPFGQGVFDATVSGLVLNFIPDPAAALAEMARVTRPGGVVGIYVWDYADGMEFLRRFWEAATAVDPSGEVHDEGLRFPICKPGPLRSLFVAAGLPEVMTSAITVHTTFASFDDYWQPFLAGQGAAGAYVARLPNTRRETLAEAVRGRLPVATDGSIDLLARAWAVRGTVRG